MKYTILILLLCLVAAVASSARPQPRKHYVPPPRHCLDKFDCDHDMFCMSGLCSEIIKRFQKCKSTQDCKAGESCSPAGWCRVAWSQQCKTAQDCKEGEFCDSLGQCVDDQPQFEPTLCSDNSECTGPESCIDGQCSVQTYPQPKRCKSTQDCKEGEVCGENGLCNSASSKKSPGGVIYGQPSRHCSDNSECKDDEVCNHRGRCVTGTDGKI